MSSILHRSKFLHPDSHLVKAIPTKRPTAKTRTHKTLLPPDAASTMQSSDLTVSRDKTLLRYGDKATSLATDGVDGALIVATLVSMQK
jgi:hypothetical protein